MKRPEKVQAALRLMGNPYASLSLVADDEPVTVEPTLEQKRYYFKKLEDPHAFNEIFEDSDDNLWHVASRNKKNNAFTDLEQKLNEVLGCYKNYVAQDEWEQLMDFKPVFLGRAGEKPECIARVINRLQELIFSLAPGEKVEYNRAKAVQIINGLKKILG